MRKLNDALTSFATAILVLLLSVCLAITLSGCSDTKEIVRETVQRIELAENMHCECTPLSEKQQDMLSNPDKYIVKPEPKQYEQSKGRSVPATGTTTE